VENLKLWRKNYRVNDKRILDETKDFLLSYLNNFYMDLKNHYLGCSLKYIPQRIEFSKDKWMLHEEGLDYVKQLVSFVTENRRSTYRGAYLIPSSYFNVDEILFMIEVNLERMPAVSELTTLNLFQMNKKKELTSRIKIFLLSCSIPDKSR
jgi:hypothetical protein